ncbi:hypothetical protein D9M71_791900 [compost metagenome]
MPTNPATGAAIFSMNLAKPANAPTSFPLAPFSRALLNAVYSVLDTPSQSGALPSIFAAAFFHCATASSRFQAKARMMMDFSSAGSSFIRHLVT